MTAQEIGEQINSIYGPKLKELGLESFVIAGYATDSDGKCARLVVGDGGGHPAFSDGLRPLLIFAARWQAGQL